MAWIIATCGKDGAIVWGRKNCRQRGPIATGRSTIVVSVIEIFRAYTLPSSQVPSSHAGSQSRSQELLRSRAGESLTSRPLATPNASWGASPTHPALAANQDLIIRNEWHGG